MMLAGLLRVAALCWALVCLSAPWATAAAADRAGEPGSATKTEMRLYTTHQFVSSVLDILNLYPGWDKDPDSLYSIALHECQPAYNAYWSELELRDDLPLFSIDDSRYSDSLRRRAAAIQAALPGLAGPDLLGEASESVDPLRVSSRMQLAAWCLKRGDAIHGWVAPAGLRVALRPETLALQEACAALLNAPAAGLDAGKYSGYVPADHWAYNACSFVLEQGLLENYPRSYFNGSPARSRFEFASAVDALLDELAKPGAGAASSISPELLGKLALVAETLRAEFSEQIELQVGR